MKRFILTITTILILSLAGPGWGATYYLRADGTAAFKTISGTSNGGAGGTVRVTTSAAHGFLAGDSIAIGKITGTTEANGTWTVANVSDTTHFDIPIVFVNAWVSGGKAVLAGPSRTDRPTTGPTD